MRISDWSSDVCSSDLSHILCLWRRSAAPASLIPRHEVVTVIHGGFVIVRAYGRQRPSGGGRRGGARVGCVLGPEHPARAQADALAPAHALAVLVRRLLLVPQRPANEGRIHRIFDLARPPPLL